jgi:lysophospholipase L1-like esterase
MELSWLFGFVSVVAILLAELSLRQVFNRVVLRKNQVIEQSAKEYLALSKLHVDPNMTDIDLRILANEYNEHVQRCVAHYGNWSTAIKSEDSMHMPDFQGKFLNVTNGLRVTTSLPTVARQRLYVFGGSTVFCGEVADKYTICSLLQADINKKGFATSVINFGRHGSTFRNRILFVERLDLAKDDLVLFWFGTNELGWKLLEGKTKSNFFMIIVRKVSEALKLGSEYLALVALFSSFFNSIVLEPICKLYAYFETRQSLKRLDRLSHLRGFEYRVFLQPNLLTKDVRTHRENVILEFFLSRDKGRIVKKLLDKNYPRFRSLIAQFNGIDMSDVFKRDDREVFADWVHLNSEGNRIVANFMFDKLENDGLFNGAYRNSLTEL